MNRRIRSRTYGGVRGRRPYSLLLLDPQLYEHLPGSIIFNSEMVETPIKLIKETGAIYDKSFGSITRLVSKITCEEIKLVYEEARNPSFCTFWNRLVKLDTQN